MYVHIHVSECNRVRVGLVAYTSKTEICAGMIGIGAMIKYCDDTCYPGTFVLFYMDTIEKVNFLEI